MLAEKLSLPEQRDEKTIVEGMMLGDYKSFSALYETYVEQLTRYSFRFTSDMQIIEDSIHDVFVSLWKSRSSLSINISLKAYLFKCMRTSLLANTKKSKRVVLFDDVNETHAQDYSLSGEEKYIEQEGQFSLKGKMANVLDHLTSKQKEVVYLRFYRGLSFDEIAVNMNLSTRACYKLMGRAVVELRRACSPILQRHFLFFLFFFSFVG